MTLSRLAGNQRTGGAGAAARRRGLAGAGLGAAQKIAPGKEMRDRLGLDRRRRGVALGTDRALDRLDQPEVGRSSQVSVSLGWPSAGGTPTLIGSGHPARGRGSLSVHRFCLGMLPPAWMTQACFARSRGLVRFMSSSIDAGSKLLLMRARSGGIKHSRRTGTIAHVFLCALGRAARSTLVHPQCGSPRSSYMDRRSS